MPEVTNKLPSLVSLAVKEVSKSLKVSTALQTLEFADRHNSDELKMNSLKFIALNMVLFFEKRSLQFLM